MVVYDGGQNDIQDISACVESIITTPRGVMPYMRGMGIPSEIMGLVSPMAKDAFYDQAVDQIETWEERVTVREVSMVAAGDHIEAKVVVEDGE